MLQSFQKASIDDPENTGFEHDVCLDGADSVGINVREMKAITLSHYKRKLGDVSQELFLTHDWDMPEGFRDKTKRDPDNYSRAEAGQAKRLKRDPKATKAMFRQCWEQSDGLPSFAAALKEQGYLLARGDQRGFVAVDVVGKVWSLSRWCGVKPKELRARLGYEDSLPSIEEALLQLQDVAFSNPRLKPGNEIPDPGFAFKRAELIARQRKERVDLLKSQETRRIAELKARRARLPRGLSGIFSRMTGRHKDLLRQFESEAQGLVQRDRDEQQVLIDKHLTERRTLERETRLLGHVDDFHATLKSSLGQDLHQSLELPPDDLPFTRAQVLQNPALVLGHISKTKARFERTDILTTLAKRIDDPFLLKELADKVLQSPELVRLEDDRKTPLFTTRDYRNAENQLHNAAQSMTATGGYGVTNNHITHAIRSQNYKMKHAFGGSLSNEQCAALDHILNDRQFACVVGLAGAGKSTLLATAMDAWRHQGITVHGAALAGKAADGLESASGIQSRTLASLEASWENGYEPISKGDVLVIDEAGMIGTRQLSRITEKINQIGAKLVLVGDPDQLQPIDAGTPFRELVKTHATAKLTEIHRQRDDWQKQASRNLAQGDISDAIESYAKRGTVKHGNTLDEAIEALVEAYTMDIAANGTYTTRLAFAHRRKDVHALNQAIRAALRSEDLTTQEETLFTTETGKRAFASGDCIVFTRNDKNLGVKNGMLGKVQETSKTEITVTLDGDTPRTLTFSPQHYRSFDHGYAVTIHKSQGATVDQAYVLASRSMDRHLAYVAMTRHRDTMRLYINNKDHPHWADKERQFNLQQKQQSKQRSGPTME